MTLRDAYPLSLSLHLALTDAQPTVIDKTNTPNRFDPVLSASAYVGHVKENERTVQLEPRLYAADADRSHSINGE